MATLVNRLFSNGNLAIAGTLNETLADTPQQGQSLLASIGGYYYYPLNNVFNIGTGAFTIECWVWPTYMQPYSIIFGGINYGISTDWGLYAGNGTTAGQVMFQFTNTQANRIAMTGTISTSTWTHVAVSRDSGGTARLFINGTLNATVTGANAWSLSNNLQKSIFGGYNGNSSTSLHGYMSSLRIINGTAVYTQSFTPSTSALPASQAANVYGSPSAAIPSGQCVLLLDVYTGTGFKDSSGNNLSGTAAGLGSVFEYDSNSPFPAQVLYPNLISFTSGNISTKAHFDEYTLNPIAGGLARRQFRCGILQVAGQFDEVSLGSLYNLNYFIVGGGGGGGGAIGGGGGAGGITTGTISNTVRGQAVYTVTVGAGGAGGSSAPFMGTNGCNTSITGGVPLVGKLNPANYIGGGGGGGGVWYAAPAPLNNFNFPGRNGGSGGGGSGGPAVHTGGSGGTATQPSSPSGGYGNAGGAGGNGGACSSQSACIGAGGGGGAGAVGSAGAGGGGVTATPNSNGAGGAGLQYTQFAPYGTTPGNPSYPGSGWFGGGGGGSFPANGGSPVSPFGCVAYGGVGGGGTGGGGGGAIAAVAGTPNTGGGGGGASLTYFSPSPHPLGAQGGSGIAIIYYSSPTQLGSGGTVMGGPAGPVFYHVFTSTGTYQA